MPDEEANCSEWWRINKSQFSLLANVARKYFCICAQALHQSKCSAQLEIFCRFKGLSEARKSGHAGVSGQESAEIDALALALLQCKPFFTLFCIFAQFAAFSFF